MSRSNLTSGVLALVLCAGLVVAADKPKPRKLDDPQSIRSALHFATTYTNAFQAGEADRAVEEGWDFDAITKDIFGKELAKQTPAEVAEIKARLLALVKSVVDKPDLSAAMAVGHFDSYAAVADDDGQVGVSYTFVAGDTKIPNKLTLSPRGTSWRVVDAEMNGTDLVMELRDGYRKVSETVTPLKFARLATAKLEEEMKAKKKQ